jgi:hypothetical protein
MQHLRMEENPILEIPHVEAASILLVGPTLKKFNNRGIVLMFASEFGVELSELVFSWLVGT